MTVGDSGSHISGRYDLMTVGGWLLAPLKVAAKRRKILKITLRRGS